MKPKRGYEALRSHRWSQNGFTYFVTLCTADRRQGLTAAEVAGPIRAEIHACEADGHWRVRAAVIMSEHVHLLVTLTGKLPLGRVIARVKAKTKHLLAAACEQLRWQGNFYEHRLRPSESVEDVIHYLFINPYRAGLAASDETYPWFWMHQDDAAWFQPKLRDNDRPFPEWLR